MITARKHSEGVLQLLDSIGRIVGWIYSPHDLKDGDKFPIKSITLDGDKIHVEVDRPLSLVEAVEAYFSFFPGCAIPSEHSIQKPVFDAWYNDSRREKEKTQ